jgi:GPI ethanolamine phosphate transferase 1
VNSLQAKKGLPLLNQVVGWILFGWCDLTSESSDMNSRCCLSAVSAFLYPFVYKPHRSSFESRLLSYFLAFSPCFVILSIRTEGLFYLSYCATLYLWTRVEDAVRKCSTIDKQQAHQQGKRTQNAAWNPNHLSGDNVRTALFFLFFVQIGFFGTGK